jgi:amidohydrolase
MLLPEALSWREEFTSWRRHLHRHPETAFEEFATADFVAGKLASFGIEVHRGLAGTGVVGTLRGTPGEGAIGLRADMDALHVQELNEFEHRSVVPGKMHACGHDGHTTMLLAAARCLAATRRFSGTVHFIFQPAEENEGGGRRMVQEGLFERFPVSEVFALHNGPGLPVGHFVAAPGARMASFDVFEITVQGRGAHAAKPHEGVDSIVVASHIVLALQSIVSRAVDPLDPAVVSVTQVHAGETWNVLPATATIRGTVRAFGEGVRAGIERRIRELVDGIAAAYGGSAQLRYERRYPATINHPEPTARVCALIEETFGPERLLHDIRPVMGSEDFAYMLEAKPGCYVWLGNGPGEGDCTLHNPRYDFNDDVVPYGCTFWVRLVEALLPAP